jgi:hypothetical protein
MAEQNRKPRRVTGKWIPPRSERARFSHSDGFNAALDNALSKTHWKSPDGTNEFQNVRVEFTATVRVLNPGSIIAYFATLTPPPPPG